MATITSVASGLWSAAGTWDAGVPVDDDTVVIAAGHVVEFDVNQSGFANGINGITITGTLRLTRTAGTYQFKLKAAKSIGGNGTFDCGTVGDQIPFNVKFTLLFNGNSCTITNGVTLNVYGQNPTYKQVRLTAGAIVGATVLSIDTDLTGDIWADGDQIGIDTITVVGAAKNEDRYIAVGGITSNSITITAGLTYKKDAGDYVTLMTRHLRMQGVSNCWSFKSTSVVHGAWFSANGGGWLVGTSAMCSGDCVYSNASYGFYVNSTYARITTGIWRGISTLFNACTGASLEGGYVGNCSQVFNGGAGHSLSGGVIYGCLYVFSGCSSVVVTGGYVYGSWGVFNSSNVVGSGFTFGVSPYQLSTTVFTFYGAVILSFNNISYSSLRKEFYSQWFDYQGTAGAYKAWCAGGVTTKQAVTKPTGYAYSMQTVLESATKEGYFQKEVTIGAGASVNITSWLRKDASMTYLPRVIVFNKASTDPFAGGAGLHTFTMTDSVDTWENDLYTYTNNTSEDVTLVIRCQGMNATGNLYSLADVEQINVDLTSALAKLVAIQAKTDNLPADPAAQSLLAAAIAAIPAGITINDILTAIVDGTLTFNDSIKLQNAVLFGKLDGGRTGTLSFRDPADTKDRVIVTVDLTNGDRDDVTLDVS